MAAEGQGSASLSSSKVALRFVAETVFLDGAGSSVLEEVSDRRRQIHSVAVLAHAAADVATPLLLSATLKVS